VLAQPLSVLSRILYDEFAFASIRCDFSVGGSELVADRVDAFNRRRQVSSIQLFFDDLQHLFIDLLEIWEHADLFVLGVEKTDIPLWVRQWSGVHDLDPRVRPIPIDGESQSPGRLPEQSH